MAAVVAAEVAVFAHVVLATMIAAAKSVTDTAIKASVRDCWVVSMQQLFLRLLLQLLQLLWSLLISCSVGFRTSAVLCHICWNIVL